MGGDAAVQFSVETAIESPIVVSFFDQAAKGEIEVVKTGEILSDTYVEKTGYGLLYHPIYEKRGLEGASFEIIAAEDIYTPRSALLSIIIFAPGIQTAYRLEECL